MITQPARTAARFVSIPSPVTRPGFPRRQAEGDVQTVPFQPAQTDTTAPPGGPVLVTGSHRSGTTWVGRILATAPHTCYLHEPFKPGWTPAEIWTRFDTWFAHLETDTAAAHEQRLARTLALHFNWRRHWVINRSVAQACCATGRWAHWTLNRLLHRRPIMKDPIAIFSAPWLAERFGMRVVVMIRHPAAFVSSIKLKNWWFEFSNWTRQEKLMSTLLRPFDREIRTMARRNEDIVEQAILQWRAFHHVIGQFKIEHPDWQFVRHEDLSLDPVGKFAGMFKAAGLSFTPRCRREVIRSSGAENLTDANRAGKSTLFTDLNSAANVRNWQRRLSPDEIRRVRDGTADVAAHFYSDQDWE